MCFTCGIAFIFIILKNSGAIDEEEQGKEKNSKKSFQEFDLDMD